MVKKKLKELCFRKNRFYDVESCLEVKVTSIGLPRVFETEASCSNPLNFQIDGFVRRAARGTGADAYFVHDKIMPNERFSDARWSPATVTVHLYKIVEDNKTE